MAFYCIQICLPRTQCPCNNSYPISPLHVDHRIFRSPQIITDHRIFSSQIFTDHRRSSHLQFADHYRSPQIITDHRIFSSQIITDHRRSLQITADHYRSPQIITDHRILCTEESASTRPSCCISIAGLGWYGWQMRENKRFIVTLWREKLTGTLSGEWVTDFFFFVTAGNENNIINSKLLHFSKILLFYTDALRNNNRCISRIFVSMTKLLLKLYLIPTSSGLL